MRRYLLDTGIAGDFINRRHGVYEHARQAVADGHRIGIGIPVLAELYYGIEFSNSAERNRELLHRALADLILWPLTEEAAEVYGRIRADLRRGGVVIQRVDLMVAAIALSLNRCTVVSSDSDLGAVPGLSLENWAA
jgi:tRNA(fMet)-specific endonuclease VapC